MQGKYVPIAETVKGFQEILDGLHDDIPESAFLFATFIVLSILLFKKNNKYTMPLYLICYGVWRLIIEFFRSDERGAVVLGLQPSQWQSILFIVLGVGLIFVIKYWDNIAFWFKTKILKKGNRDK